MHAYHHFIPRVVLSTGLFILPDLQSLTINISFPMMGFAYLIHQEVALSIWLFYLIGYAINGYFTMIGLTRTRPWTSTVVPPAQSSHRKPDPRGQRLDQP